PALAPRRVFPQTRTLTKGAPRPQNSRMGVFRSLSLTVYLAAATCLVIAACSKDPKKAATESCETSEQCASGQLCVGGECTTPTTETDGAIINPPAQIKELRIEPESAALEALNGDTPSQDFATVGIYDDSTEINLKNAIFELDTPTIGE